MKTQRHEIELPHGRIVVKEVVKKPKGPFADFSDGGVSEKLVFAEDMAWEAWSSVNKYEEEELKESVSKEGE